MQGLLSQRLLQPRRPEPLSGCWSGGADDQPHPPHDLPASAPPVCSLQTRPPSPPGLAAAAGSAPELSAAQALPQMQEAPVQLLLWRAVLMPAAREAARRTDIKEPASQLHGAECSLWRGKCAHASERRPLAPCMQRVSIGAHRHGRCSRCAEAAWGRRGGPVPGVGARESSLLLVRGLKVLDEVQDAAALVV